jgi:hypothetical protein
VKFDLPTPSLLYHCFISFIFQQGDLSEAGNYPSFFNALQWFGSKTNYFRLIDPRTEIFTLHQILHHKRNLLKDEKELLKSAKQIVINFANSLKITTEKESAIPVGEEFLVK